MGAPINSSQSGNSNAPERDNDLKKPSSNNDNRSNDSKSAYLSLIQQYLSVFMVENATFFAERCVAEYPNSDEAVYLLALCYYRAGSPKSARQAIEQRVCTTSLASSSLTSSVVKSSGNSDCTCGSSMKYLAAQCSFDLNDYTRAEEALLSDCRAAYKQNRVSMNDGGTAPNNANSLDDWILSTTPCPVPNGAAGLALLGDICRHSNRTERAIKYYKMSLKLDPFLWTSFQALSELGVKEDEVSAASVFGVSPSVCAVAMAAIHGTDHVSGNSLFTATSNGIVKTPLQPMGTPAHHRHHQAASHSVGGAVSQYSKHHLFQPNHNHSMMAPSSALSSVPRHHHRSVHFVETPGLTPIPVNASMQPAVAETPVPSRSNRDVGVGDENNASSPAVLRRAAAVATRQYYPPSPETPVTGVTRSMRYLRGLGSTTTGPNAELRNRAMSNSAAGGAVKSSEGGAGSVVGARSLFVTARSSENQASNRSAVKNTPNITNQGGNCDGNNSINGNGPVLSEKPDTKEPVSTAKVQDILELLAVAGAAYQCLCQYKCREALQLLQQLPYQQMHTGWALHLQGRAHLELNDFLSAQRCLEYMQVQDPGRVKGLELLSTVYWQLKKEVELAHLAQKCVDWNRLSPEAWCVVGNCFSLQKDHETALSFFARSLQLDPDFTYTHTLSGYEYMANEDFEKATACFRQALRTDERHYNAWYGLGAIYHRQEKFDLAEYHFERAVSIHPGSSVLRCNLGMAQYANGNAYKAMETLQEAFRLDPRNPQARFQRATIYSAMQQPEEALKELIKVRDAAPREATVHFAMGKVLKRLGRPEQAMKCFLTAMDLDPKDNQLIKSAMDKLDEPEVDEEVAAF